MLYKVFRMLILAAVFLPTLSSAQEPSNFKHYDQATWHLYQQKQWDSLILVGKAALADGNDYQYLNARMGVAWFEKGDFRMASHYFYKALKMNSGDEFAREYLYFSYLYSGRSGAARNIATGFQQATRERLALPATTRPAFVYAEMGPVISNAVDPWRDVPITGPDSVYGEFNLPGSAFYFHAGGSFDLGSFVTAYAGYSNLSLDRYQRIQIATLDTIKRSYGFAQHQAYLNFSIEPFPGLRIVPSIHYIYNRSKPVFASYNADSVRYIFKQRTLKNNQVAAGLALYAEWKRFGFTLHTNYANLMDYNQIGLGGAITWYPTGNLKSWIRMHGTWFSEEGTTRWVLEPSAGIKLSNHIWFESSVALGDMTRYVDETNFLVYNTDDKTTLRAQGVFYIPVFDNVMFSIRYIFNRAEGSLYQYDLTEASLVRESIDYNKHTILGGIKWNF